jgi:iron complex outermembrane recepter protein
MSPGPWMRTVIAAAGLAALGVTRSAVAREAENDSGSGEPAARSYGQFLVDRTLKNHPELIGLDLYATPPNAPHCLVIASASRDHVGRESDLCALDVVKTNKPAVPDDVQTGQRIEVDVPLQDKSGTAIGAMQAVYACAKGEDEARFLSQAEALRGEMQRQIPAVAKLVQPVTPTDGRDIGGTQSLPTTKEIVSGRTLAENEQEGYAEAVKNVAGVAPANSKGSANDSIYIRGIKLNLFSNYRINGGLPVAGVITMPNEDKARLETLKGANALQFGVASPAGIINMITKRAGENDVTSVSAAATSFGQYGAAADVGRRFGDERQLGVRLNGSATQLENGVHSLGGDGEFASAGLDYRVDRLTLQGDFEYYRKHVPEQAGVSLLDPVNGVIPVTPVPDPRNLLSGPWAIYTPETTNAQVRADYLVADNLKVVVETGRSYSDRSRFTTRIGGYDINTGAGGAVRVSTVTQNYRNTFGMLELQSAFSTWMLAHQLTFGGSVTDRRAETPENRKEFILPQKQNIYDPIALAPPVFPGAPTALPLQISRDGGFYAYDTISFHPHAPRLLLGLRYTQDYENNGKAYDPVSCPKCGPTTSWITLPSFGALWDVIPGLTLFGSYMKGLEAGATAPANAFNANEILPAQVSTQKELGVRASYAGTTVSISVFEIDKANPVTDPNPNDYCGGNPMCFVNSGQINYRGLEATVNAQLTRLFTVDAGGQWLRAIQNSPDPKFDGLAPENTPRFIGNVRLGFRVPWASGLTLSAGASGVTSRFVNFLQQGSIPGYIIYSAGASWVVRNRMLDVRRLTFLLNVDNLTNLRYWNSVQTGTYGIGMDRVVKVTMKIDV